MKILGWQLSELELITSQSPLQSAHTHKHILLMIIHERNTNYKTSTWQLFTLVVSGHNNVKNKDRRASEWSEASKSNDAEEIITKETGISPSSSSETEVHMDKKWLKCYKFEVKQATGNVLEMSKKKKWFEFYLQGRKCQIICTKLECGLLRESNCNLRRELRQLCTRSEDHTVFICSTARYTLSKDKSDEKPHRAQTNNY